MNKVEDGWSFSLLHRRPKKAVKRVPVGFVSALVVWSIPHTGRCDAASPPGAIRVLLSSSLSTHCGPVASSVKSLRIESWIFPYTALRAPSTEPCKR